MNWAILIDAIKDRDTAIKQIDFNDFNLYDREKVLDSNSNCLSYSSKLCAYSNVCNPADYVAYGMGLKVELVSEATLHMICKTRYNRMYAHMISRLSEGGEGVRAEAGYYFQLIALTALTQLTEFVVRDVNFPIPLPSAAIRRNQYLYRFTVGLGRISPSRQDVITEITNCAAVNNNGLAAFNPAVSSTSAAAKRSHDLAFPVGGAPVVAGPVNRTLFYAPAGYANIDAFDAVNRGYQFTISGSHSIQYDAMRTFLTSIHASAQNPFHLFVGVPQDIFDSWISPQTLSKANPPPLTAANRTYINNRVRQYVIRIPNTLN